MFSNDFLSQLLSTGISHKSLLSFQDSPPVARRDPQATVRYAQRILEPGGECSILQA